MRIETHRTRRRHGSRLECLCNPSVRGWRAAYRSRTLGLRQGQAHRRPPIPGVHNPRKKVKAVEPWVAFGIEYQGHRFIETVTDEYLPESFLRAFSKVVSLHGDGGSDYVTWSVYVKGEVSYRSHCTFALGDLLIPTKLFGVHLVALSNWAGFGRSPVDLSGDQYALDEVPPLQPSAFAVEPVSFEPKMEIAGTSDALYEAQRSGDLEARIRYGIAMIQRFERPDEGLAVIEGWNVIEFRSGKGYLDLPDGPLKEAAAAWVRIFSLFE